MQTKQQKRREKKKTEINLSELNAKKSDRAREQLVIIAI